MRRKQLKPVQRHATLFMLDTDQSRRKLTSLRCDDERRGAGGDVSGGGGGEGGSVGSYIVIGELLVGRYQVLN